jgi:hypothetical protein
MSRVAALIAPKTAVAADPAQVRLGDRVAELRQRAQRGVIPPRPDADELAVS